MKQLFLALAGALLGSAGCRQYTVDTLYWPVDDPCQAAGYDTTSLKTRWSAVVGPEGAVEFMLLPYYWQNQLFCTYKQAGQHTLTVLNAATAAPVWQIPVERGNMYAADDRLVYSAGQSVTVVDLRTQTRQKALEVATGQLDTILAQRGNLFVAQHTEEEVGTDTLVSSLILLDATTLQSRPVYQLRKPRQHAAGAHLAANIVIDVTSAGDTVLLWTEQWRSYSGRAGYIVWLNLTTGESDFTRTNDLSIDLPLTGARAISGLCFFKFQNDLYAVSSASGGRLWEERMAYGDAEIVPLPDAVGIFGAYFFTAYQLADGAQLFYYPFYQNFQYRYTAAGSFLRNDRFFFIDVPNNRLAAVDVSSGCRINYNRLPPTAGWGRWHGHVVRSPDNAILYATDSRRVWAFDMPE